MAAMQLGQRVVRFMFWNAVTLPVASVATFLSSIVIARSLALETYSVYAVALATISTLMVHGDAGTHTGAVKLISELESRAGRAAVGTFLRAYLGLRFLVFASIGLAVVLARAPLIAVLGVSPVYGFIMPYIGVIIVLDGLSAALTDFSTALLHNKVVNVVGIVVALLQPAAVLGAVISGFGIPGILFAMVFTSAIRLGLLTAATARLGFAVVGEQPRLESGIWPRFWKLSALGYMDKFVNYLYSWPFVVLLLSAHSRVHDVALFTLAARFVMQVLSMVLSPFSNVLIPLFVSVFSREDEARAQTVFAYTIKGITWVCVAAGALLLGSIKELLPLVFSSKFEGAVPICLVLIGGFFVEYSIYASANAVLIAAERTTTFIVLKGAALVAVPLLVWSIASVPLLSVAALFAIVRVLVAMVLLQGALQMQRLRCPWPSLLKIAAAGAVTVIVMEVVPLHVVLRLMIGTATFVAASRLLRVFDDSERQRIVQEIRPWLSAHRAGWLVGQLI